MLKAQFFESPFNGELSGDNADDANSRLLSDAPGLQIIAPSVLLSIPMDADDSVAQNAGNGDQNGSVETLVGVTGAQNDIDFLGDISAADPAEIDPNFWIVTPDTPTNGINSLPVITTDLSGNGGVTSSPIMSSENPLPPSSFIKNSVVPVTVMEGATAEIAGASAQSVSFQGPTGTLKLDDAVAFTGQVSGLSGSDALDLADVSYGPNTTASFLGNTSGGTLTVSNGTQTANIALVGDYLSSSWTLSSDGNGGTVVVDPVSSNTWQPIDIGAGGFLTGMDVAQDGTMVVRANVYGAYLWNGTQWQQLVTATSMPASVVASPFNDTGVYEIEIAPSNSNILYMMYEDCVFKSTNKGTTWTQTSLAQVAIPYDNYGNWGQKMAIDPSNPNEVFVGTSQNGLFVTTDGGNTWSNVSGVPASTLGPSYIDGSQSPGITGILFDPANTNIIFAASYGHGVYESTNGGTTWNNITGATGPSAVNYAAISSTGAYYACDGYLNLWKYANGTWTELLTGSQGRESFDAVAVDPTNPNHVITVSQIGSLTESFNGGASWGGLATNSSLSATDIPWQAKLSPYLGASGLFFNPLNPSELLASGGNDFWNTTLSGAVTSSTPIVWNSQGVGIEELVANEIIAPPGGVPVLASWDRAFFYESNLNAYPSTWGPPANGLPVTGWSVDYASSDPRFIVGLADNGYLGGSVVHTGYSTNGGQTWTDFPTDIPGAGTAGSGVFGGTIAASTPSNIIWAPANGNQPYYTLNGGATWNPIVLPGVSSWSNFDAAYFYDTRTVTADRVLANTFYLYDPGHGVFETTNGGVSWAAVSNIYFNYSGTNSELQSVPGEAGNLFWAPGWLGGPGHQEPVGGQFYQSTNGGAAWTTVPNVLDVWAFGFGAAAPGQSYPAIYIVGWVNNVYGIWQSINDAKSWTQIGTYPENSLDMIKTISGDPNIYGQVYVGFAGSGYAYLPADPVVSAVAASPASGIELPGNSITLTLTMSEVVTVTGTPTLSLNDGGTAIYSGGSGTGALTFSYTVSASDDGVSALAITHVNEPNGATITSANGNLANLAGALTTFSGLEVDPPNPWVMSIASTPASGDLNAGKTVTFTLKMDEMVTVSGGTPTLTLNDGGIATYSGGSGSSALTFSYAVAAGQNTAALAATTVNLNGATINDSTGNVANLSLSGLTQPTGPQIDTATPTVSAVVDSPTSGDLNPGTTVTLTLDMSEVVTVSGGIPTLALNDGGTATYTGGSGTSALTFSYTVTAGQNTASLAATAINLSTATITDAAGNAANLSLSGLTQSGPEIGVVITSVVATGSAITAGTGDVVTGDVVSLTVNLSQAVAVANGTPTLSLNDGGTATYTSGSGTNALTFSYTVAAGQSTPALAVTAVNYNGAIVTNNVTVTAGSGGSLTDPSGHVWSFGALNSAGGGYAILRDGAQFAGGYGVTLNLVNGSIFSENNINAWWEVAGTGWAPATAPASQPANLANALTTFPGLQINPLATPTIASLVESPPSGDLHAGQTVTFTLNLSEAVTVAGSTSTLTLNDGGTATYAAGSGTGALTFSYTVAAGQNTGNLAATAVNLNGTTITDAAGNAANLSLTGLTQTGPQIDTTAPVITAIAESPTNGQLNTGKTVAYTLTMSEAVTVSGAMPTLSLNDGGTATYTEGSGTNTLTFSYTVLAGQNTPDLRVTAFNLNGATMLDGAGNSANVSLAGVAQGSPAIDTTMPAAPLITSETIVNNQLTLHGTALDQGVAEQGDLVKIYDGTTLLGTTTTDAMGAWSYTTAPLSDGSHALSATVTDLAGNTSVASQSLNVLTGPPAPAITGFSPDTGFVGDGATDANALSLTGTAEANTTVSIYDGSTLLGTTAVNGNGTWSFTTAKLIDGTHIFTATDTNTSALTGPASSVFKVTVDTAIPTDTFSSDVKNSNGSFTLSGTALDKGIVETGDTIKIYDGTTYLGSTTVGSNGQWSFKTAPLSNTVHYFNSTVTDVAGNVGPSTGDAIYGSSNGKDQLLSTPGNDIMTGGSSADTFVFNGSSFGKDVITDFVAQGGSNHHDVIQFSSTVFNSFAAVLAHAAQVGSNTVITLDAADSVTLNNLTLNKLTSGDFHFA